MSLRAASDSNRRWCDELLGRFANSNLRGWAIRLVEIDIFERFGERFVFGLFEQFLKLCF